MTNRFIKNFLMGATTAVMAVVVVVMMVTTWAEHPAEQPVSGIEYMEMINR